MLNTYKATQNVYLGKPLGTSLFIQKDTLVSYQTETKIVEVLEQKDHFFSPSFQASVDLGYFVLVLTEDVQVSNILTGTTTTDSFEDSLAIGCVWHYTVYDGTNFRAGQIQAFWNASLDIVQFNETTTTDIGDTSGVSFLVDIFNNIVRLQCITTSNGWNIRAKRILI